MNDDAAHPEPVAVATYASSGEAEVGEAKLRAFGIFAVVDDQVEGGVLPVEGEPSVSLMVQAGDAEQAREILVEPVPDLPID